jgi:hypothetical protein
MIQQVINLVNTLDAAQIAAAVTGLYTFANVVARITPTPKDDEIVGKVWKFLNFLLLKSKVK